MYDAPKPRKIVPKTDAIQGRAGCVEIRGILFDFSRQY